MKKSLIGLAFSGLLLFSCGKGEGDQGNTSASSDKISGAIEIDGSSTVYPITSGIAELFAGDYPDVDVIVGVSGTGGGFKKFCKGEKDINDASREIKGKEEAISKENKIGYHKITVAFDGLAVVVNKNNSFVDYLTVEELKKIWENTGDNITMWSQVREGWPEKEINLYGPGEASGTFDYFNEAILGKGVSCRKDYNPSENDNVLVKGISADEFALGYFGLAYYEDNKEDLKIVPVDGGNGPVVPNLETVKSNEYSPLSRPIFIYVSDVAAKKKQVDTFVDFYLENAAEVSKMVGYIPLPEEKYAEEKASYEAFTKK